MDKAAFQSRLGAVVVNERLARSERPKRGMVNRMSIARLVAELRTLNVWEAFSRNIASEKSTATSTTTSAKSSNPPSVTITALFWIARLTSDRRMRDTPFRKDRAMEATRQKWMRDSYPKVTSIHSRICGKTGKIRRDQHAHAHADTGMICFFTPVWDVSDDKPSVGFIHEYAHVVSPVRGHGATWQRTFQRELERAGYGRIPLQYLDQYTWKIA